MSLTENARVRWSLVSIFVLFAALYALTGFGRIDSFDGEMMYRVTESLVERKSLVVTDEIFHSNEPYSLYGLGTSIFAIPFYLAGKSLGGDSRWAASLLNSFVTALTAALVYYFGLRLGFSRRVSLFTTMCFGLGSLAWPYAKTFFSEPLTTLFLLAAVVGAYAFRADARTFWLPVVGFALGAAVLTREDSLLAVPLVLTYLIWPGGSGWRIDSRGAVLLLIPMAVFFAVTYWYHDLRFHSLLSGWAERAGNNFSWTPGTFFTGVYGLTLSSGKGLVFYTPLVLLSLASWRHFWSRRALECCLFSAIVIERVAFFAFLIKWYGGVSWGPRYIAPTIPFLILPIGYLLATSEWGGIPRRAIIAGVFSVSFLAQLPGVAIYYAHYWNATINTRLIIFDQIFFSPQYSPLVGQFRWMMEGQNVQWLLPVVPSWEWPVRLALGLVMLSAAVALALLHRAALKYQVNAV